MLTARPNLNHACAESRQQAKCVLFLAASQRSAPENPPSCLGARTHPRPRDPRDHAAALAMLGLRVPPTIALCATSARSDSCAPNRCRPQTARLERSNYFQQHWWPTSRGASWRAQKLHLAARRPSARTTEEFQPHALQRDHAACAPPPKSRARRAKTQEHRQGPPPNMLQSRRP